MVIHAVERNEVGRGDKVAGGVGLMLYRGYSGQASLKIWAGT